MEISYNFNKVVPIQVLWRLALQKEIYFRSNLLHLQIIKFSYQIHKSINIHESKEKSEKKFCEMERVVYQGTNCQVCWCVSWGRPVRCCLGMEHVKINKGNGTCDDIWEWNMWWFYGNLTCDELWEWNMWSFYGNGTCMWWFYVNGTCDDFLGNGTCDDLGEWNIVA